MRAVTVAALCLTEFCALGALVGPLLIGLQMRVAHLPSGLTPEARLSTVETAGAITAMIGNFVFGWLSDRTARRFGHRSWWILGASITGGAAVVVAAHVPSLPLLVVVWVCAQGSYNAVFASLYGTLSDLVAPGDRTRVTGWFSFSAIGAIAFSAGLAALLYSGHLGEQLHDPKVIFFAMAVLNVPVAAVASWHLRGLRLPAADRPVAMAVRPRTPREVFDALAGAGAPFWWVWLQRMLAQTAYVFVVVYGVFVLVRRTGQSPADAAPTVATSIAAGAVIGMLMSAGGSRALARRWGYGPTLSLGILLLMAANVTLMMATGTSAFVVAVVLAGAGLGTYTGLDLAVALSVVPASAGGRFLGLFGIAKSLPQSVVPAIGPLLLALGTGDLVGTDRSLNYFAFFTVGSMLALWAVVLIPKLTLPDAGRTPAPGVRGSAAHMVGDQG